MRLALLACLCVWAGCGDDQECALDTDCELFQICVAERCVARGTSRDAGAREGGPGDGGGLDSGGLDAAVDGGPDVTRTGSIDVTQTPIPMAEPSHVVSATFTETTGASASACTQTTMDGCVLSDCFFPTPAADAGMPVDAGMPTFPSAGTVLVDGDPIDVMIEPQADGTYPPASGMGQIWAAGADVVVSAAGADVPAFSSTLVGPSASMVDSPSFATPPVMVDRAMPLTFTWAGGSGTVQAQVANSMAGMEGTQSVSLVCTFDAAANTGTIPSALLEMVPTGDAATFTVKNVVEGLPDVAGWTVTVRLSTPGRLDNGAPASTITLTDSTP